MAQRFNAELIGRGPKSAWVFLPIPFDVAAVFGSRGRVAVSGTLNGFAFRNSLLPEGDGTHAMPVSKELQKGAKVKCGDTVEVVLERDVLERVVTVPPELAAALRSAAPARTAFEALAYSHKKEYVEWIAGAKKDETRVSRAQKAVAMLVEGKRLR